MCRKALGVRLPPRAPPLFLLESEVPPEREGARFATLLRTGLLVCAVSALFVLLIWIVFRRLEL